MVDLDDSIGKILLNLQKNDPETFKKLMKKTLEENLELLDDSIDIDNSEIEKYNNQIDDYNNKIDND